MLLSPGLPQRVFPDDGLDPLLLHWRCRSRRSKLLLALLLLELANLLPEFIARLLVALNELDLLVKVHAIIRISFCGLPLPLIISRLAHLLHPGGLDAKVNLGCLLEPSLLIGAVIDPFPGLRLLQGEVGGPLPGLPHVLHPLHLAQLAHLWSPPLLGAGLARGLEVLLGRALEAVLSTIRQHKVDVRVLSLSFVDGEREGELVFGRDLAGEGGGQFLLLLEVQFSWQRGLDLLVDAPVGALPFIRRAPVRSRLLGSPRGHVPRRLVKELVPPLGVLPFALDIVRPDGGRCPLGLRTIRDVEVVDCHGILPGLEPSPACQEGDLLRSKRMFKYRRRRCLCKCAPSFVG